MSDKLKILLVDDSEDDAFFVMRAIKKGGLNAEITHVTNEAALREKLNDEWDILISDHAMPRWSSTAVIHTVKNIYPDLPIIVVSGTMPEDIGVSAMGIGAQDYVMKDNLSRLVPVIEREMAANETRKAKDVAEQGVRFLSCHDTLTSLPNRRFFERSLNDASTMNSPNLNVLMYLDLDQFKVVNETCGHVAGDELLKQVTKTIQSAIKDAHLLARLGGDEFGILMIDVTEKQALNLAENIRSAVDSLRFAWQGTNYSISISIGIVSLDLSKGSVAELMSSADIACYAAKERGRNGIQWYSEDNAEYHQRRNELLWVNKLKEALQNDKFELFFQPMESLWSEDHNQHGEFLLRLHNDDGFVAPGEFIPAAEKFNLMPKIDRWVVKHAFNYVAARGEKASDETYFINLSGQSLSDETFFDDVRALQKETKVLPNSICFEITETAAIDNLSDAVGFISEIREQGFRFALDDFGVGMSSFTYLKTIPLDYLKIDGSFVLNMLKAPIDMGIVSACNTIAHAVGLKTIAEFVETSDIQDALAKLGVDYGQGYGIARPAPLQ